MKKRVYRVRTRYIFEGVFEVSAESREEARHKVILDCGLVMGGSIHSTLPDEEINYHCEDPVCVEVCPTTAMSVRDAVDRKSVV